LESSLPTCLSAAEDGTGTKNRVPGSSGFGAALAPNGSTSIVAAAATHNSVRLAYLMVSSLHDVNVYIVVTASFASGVDAVKGSK
jgi:hypothetical protein